MFAVKLCMLASVTCLFLVVHVSGTTAKSKSMNETKYLLIPQSSNRTKNETNRKETTACRAWLRKEDKAKFLSLTEHSLVNIIDMRFVYENNETTYTKSVIWVNSVGREILLLLDMDRLFITSTLNAGRRSIETHVMTQPKGCIWINATTKYFVEMGIATHYSKLIKPEEEICFSMFPTKRKPRWCCNIKIIEKKKCYLSIGSQSVANLMNLKLITIYLFLSLLTLNAWYIYVLFLQQFPYGGKYYKLSGSPISLTSIYIKIGRGGSFGSSLFRIFCLLFLGVLCLLSFVRTSNSIIGLFFRIYIIYSPLFCLLPILSTCLCKYFKLPTRKSYGKCTLVEYYQYLFHANSIKGNEFHKAVHLLTLPFNINVWKNPILDFCRNKLSRWGQNLTNNIIMKYAFYFVCIFIIFFYIVILIGSTTIIMCINLCYNAVMISAIFHCLPDLRGHFSLSCMGIFYGVYAIMYYSLLIVATFATLFSASFIWVLIPHAIIPLFSGLILNSIYYFPYVTFISVASFYTWASWKSLTGEYFALKILTYEALQNRQSNNDVNLDKINDDQYTVYVVSKKLYDKIRERLLPYNLKFLVFFLKLLLISVFAYGVFTLVKMLQAVDSSRTVTVIATLTAGALPYILNIVMEKMSEEEKKAQNEIMKGNVERLVKTFTCDDDPELSKTILILPEPEISSDTDVSGHLMQNVNEQLNIS